MPPNARPAAVVRVSTDDQDMRQQLAEVHRWCVSMLGVKLADADIYLEQGVSGWKNRTLASRPKLADAVAGCLAGRYTHLVVHKVDRSARNVALMAGVIDQLQAAGVVFVSVLEGLDTSQLGAAFVIKLLLTFAEHFGNNLSAEVKKGKRKRVAAGLPNGQLPYGAVTGADGVPVPDLRPITLANGVESTKYAGLVRMWRGIATGSNPAEIARMLNDTGYPTDSPRWKHRAWSRSTVRRMLDNRFYVGEVRDGAGGWLAGAHRPLISQEIWESAHAALIRHQMRPDRAKRGSMPRIFGRGILRCATCRAKGYDIGYHAAKNQHGTVYYGCGTRNRGLPCPEHMVREDRIAEHLLALIRWEIAPDELAEAVTRYQEQTAAAGTDPAKLRAKIAQLKLRLKRIAELYELGEYVRAVYLERRKGTQAEIARLEQEVRAAQPQDVGDLDAAIATIRALPHQWDTLDVEGQAGVVRELFRTIWLQQGRVVELEPQPAFAALFALALPALVGGIR